MRAIIEKDHDEIQVVDGEDVVIVESSSPYYLGATFDDLDIDGIKEVIVRGRHSINVQTNEWTYRIYLTNPGISGIHFVRYTGAGAPQYLDKSGKWKLLPHKDKFPPEDCLLFDN